MSKAQDREKVSEDRLQSEIIQWWEANCDKWEASIHELFHIPNGLVATPNAKYCKSLGVRPGYPDLMLAIPNSYYHGLFIELKRPESNAKRLLSNCQRRTIESLNNRGYYATVVNNLDDAIMVITAYMEG